MVDYFCGYRFPVLDSVYINGLEIYCSGVPVGEAKFAGRIRTFASRIRAFASRIMTFTSRIRTFAEAPTLDLSWE